jgi:tetratricopeptide (TPR) repeat protein
MKRFDRAILLFEELLNRRKAQHGPDHADTLKTQAQLGIIFRDAGRFADAIRLLDEAHRKGRQYPQLAWVGNDLLTAYVRAGKPKEATALVTEQVRAARKQFPPGSLPLAAALAVGGKALLDVKAYEDAEPLVREALSIREKKDPNLWGTHNARSLLGAALLGRERYAEAEPLLRQGYAGLKGRQATIPSGGKDNLAAALERLVRLYDAWGKSEAAARWRKALERAKALAKPPAGP